MGASMKIEQSCYMRKRRREEALKEELSVQKHIREESPPRREMSPLPPPPTHIPTHFPPTRKRDCFDSSLRPQMRESLRFALFSMLNFGSVNRSLVFVHLSLASRKHQSPSPTLFSLPNLLTHLFPPLIPPPTPWSGLFTSLRPRLLVLGWKRRKTCWRSGRSPPKSL